MNTLNIIELLNQVDLNTQIEIKYGRSKNIDWIEIETNDFSFSIDEYGNHTLRGRSLVLSGKDIEFLEKVKIWVKSYFNIVM